jgi:hypothetical protein
MIIITILAIMIRAKIAPTTIPSHFNIFFITNLL